MLPKQLLRLEGAAVAIAAVVVYFDHGYAWWLFLAVILAPDLSMIGFVLGPAPGSATYNCAHTYVGPVILAAVGLAADATAPTELALIWLAHIGVDHMLGYGLKYPSAFKDTHLQRV